MKKQFGQFLLVFILFSFVHLSKSDLDIGNKSINQTSEEENVGNKTQDRNEEEIEKGEEIEGENENKLDKLYSEIIDWVYQTWAEFIEFTEIIPKLGSLLAIWFIVLFSIIIGYIVGKKVGKSSIKSQDLIININKWFKQLFKEIDKNKKMERRYKKLSQFFYISAIFIIPALFAVFYYSYRYENPYFMWMLGIAVPSFIIFIWLGKLLKVKSVKKSEQKYKQVEEVAILVRQLDPDLLKKMTEVVNTNRARDAISDEGCSKRCKVLVEYYKEDIKRHKEVFDAFINFQWCEHCGELRLDAEGYFMHCSARCSSKFLAMIKPKFTKYDKVQNEKLNPLWRQAEDMKREIEEKLFATKAIFKDYMKNMTEGESMKSIISKAEKKDI